MDHTRSNVNLTVAALLMAMFMAALDQTIVSTAMPTIVGEFKEFDFFVWVFSAYMISSVIATPIFGKLSDMYGRKTFFVAGLSIFMVSSILCGTADSMTELVIYRAIQGIGGGAVMPLCFAVLFDLFPPEKRGKMNGLFGAVFGLSSVFGPLVGAWFTDSKALGWEWIFFINIPIGIISLAMLIMFYKESNQKSIQVIDWTGLVIFTSMILCLMFGIEMGEKEGWASPIILSLFGGFIALLTLFIVVEQKVSNPIISPKLFQNKLFTLSQVASFIYGAIMVSGATYIPLFIQGVFGEDASSAGQTLTPMMLAVVASSIIGGRFVNRFTYRGIMLVSGGVLLTAITLLSTIDADTSRWVITLYMIIVGLGIGVSFVVFNLSSLHGVPPEDKGAATSMVVFFRTIGSALGVTIFGVLQVHALQQSVAKVAQNPEQLEMLSNPQMLLNPQIRATFDPATLKEATIGLANSISYVYQWSLILPVVALICVYFMGNARVVKSERTTENHAPSFE